MVNFLVMFSCGGGGGEKWGDGRRDGEEREMEGERGGEAETWRGGALPAHESLRLARQEVARCQQGGPALLGGRRTSQHSAHVCVPALRYPESKTRHVNRTEGLANMEPRGPLQMWGGGRFWFRRRDGNTASSFFAGPTGERTLLAVYACRLGEKSTLYIWTSTLRAEKRPAQGHRACQG